MNIDLNFDDTNLKSDRIFYEQKILADKYDNEANIISDSKIISLFQQYNTAFLENNMTDMIKFIQKLTKIAKRRPICYFPELDNSSLSQLINQSLYFPNLIYHNSLLDFFQFSFYHDQIPFLYSFLKNDLFFYIINSAGLFPENEDVLLQSFVIINEILEQLNESNSKREERCIENQQEECNTEKDIFHQLLNPEFLELFLELFRKENLPNEAKIQISSVIKNSISGILIIQNPEQDKNEEIEFNNILLFLRQILEDESINFLWPISFQMLNLLIQRKRIQSITEVAKYVMIEKEFHLNCTQILLNTDHIDTIESIIYVLKSYFKNATLLFPDIDTVFNKIMQISIENEVIMRSTLCLFNKFIKRPEHLTYFVKEFMNFDKYQFFKNYYQETSYIIKKKILKIIGILIKELINSDEQVIQIIIPLNFMEDFVQILYANDYNDNRKLFNRFIGTIVSLLRKKVDYNPPDVFWIQFEESGGVSILEDILHGEEQVFAIRAELFFKNIYSLRPVCNS